MKKTTVANRDSGPVLEKLMRISEAADYLNVSPITLYRKAQAGIIPGLKIGVSWRFKREILDAWIAQQSAVKGGAR